MALDSAIGFASATLLNPPTPAPTPVYLDSGIGFASAQLTGPLSSDSQIGYASGTLVAPAEPVQTVDSEIGFKSVTLRRPHHPIGVKMPDGAYRYVPILTHLGSGVWR